MASRLGRICLVKEEATMTVKLSEKIAQGYALSRGNWEDVDPRTKVVPPKRGKQAPYRRQTRRKGEERC